MEGGLSCSAPFASATCVASARIGMAHGAIAVTLAVARLPMKPPAPRIDGWDVSAFYVGQECEVESRIGNYLIIAGYAVRVEHDGKPERKDSGAART